MQVLFVIMLFVAIWFGLLTFLKFFRGEPVRSWHFIVTAISWTFVIAYFMGLLPK